MTGGNLAKCGVGKVFKHCILGFIKLLGEMPKLRLGIDVGGTNTDAALIADGVVVASIKTPTTEDIGSGIVGAIRKVIGLANVPREKISTVIIGTTQFTNAFVARNHLNEVGVVRLCLPAAKDIAPMTGWPEDLRGKLGSHTYLLPGGYEFDGREIAPFDEDAVVKAAKSIHKKGLIAVAISSVCSLINASMEKKAASIIREENPDIAVTLSSNIGKIGLIERENAAIMNASLTLLATHVVGAIRDSLHSLKIFAPFFISQNDGTLMSADFVENNPILTFASGPTNSMRGAAYLSGISHGIVVDIGGTTTDVGALISGYPRQSSLPVDIGSVRTNFRMPDVVAVGLGGGSHVKIGEEVTIGPESVGFRLTEQAQIFGGEILTTTDIVVAAGLQDIGDRKYVEKLKPELIEQALFKMNTMVDDTIERVKTSAGGIPVVLVGGGSILVSQELQTAERVVVPENSAEANAIGAAMAQVSGVVDHICTYQEQSREEAIGEAKQEAVRQVREMGGDEATAEVVELEEIPLSYSANGTVRLRVKAVGDLLINQTPSTNEAMRQ